jgi:hypothetical protein
MAVIRPLGMSLLLATSIASAADTSFYFIFIADKGTAALFSEARSAPKGELPFAFVDRAATRCCFKARTRPGSRKTASEADEVRTDVMSEDDKPMFRYAGYVSDPATPEPALAYGVEGMQSVTKKARDTYQVTLRYGDPVFVRTCLESEGLRLQLFHRQSDQKPYASYYYYFRYDVEPTCR